MKRVEQQKELDAAVAGKKSVVLFHATWCPVCRNYRPFFEQAAKKSGLDVVEAVIDDEENPIWDDHKIEYVPTVFIYENGKILKRLYGRPGVGLTQDELTSALKAV
ncbi:MAG TPA: thioredoxin family protein [Myxococcales bacterium]|jgi:thioredoxin 1